jgi:pentose-5-phosphate-3-epimerase
MFEFHTFKKKFTFHYETVDSENIKPFIKKINATGMNCSIAIKPDTNVDVLFPLLDDSELNIFMILVMVKFSNKILKSNRQVSIEIKK